MSSLPKLLLTLSPDGSDAGVDGLSDILSSKLPLLGLSTVG